MRLVMWLARSTRTMTATSAPPRLPAPPRRERPSGASQAGRAGRGYVSPSRVLYAPTGRGARRIGRKTILGSWFHHGSAGMERRGDARRANVIAPPRHDANVCWPPLGFPAAGELRFIGAAPRRVAPSSNGMCVRSRRVSPASPRVLSRRASASPPSVTQVQGRAADIPC
jgi:hypothetical protein